MPDTEPDNRSRTDNGRRHFLNWVLGLGLTGWAAAILYPVLDYLVPPKTREPEVNSVELGKTDKYAPNSGTIFKFGNKPGILIRTPGGDFKAFSAVCTHLQCTVQYRKDMKLIWCACHNGKYNLNGTNIAGPPPRPLKEYDVVIKGGKVFVKKEA